MRLTITVLEALVLSVILAGNPASAWFWDAPSWSQINADLASDFPAVPVIGVQQLNQRLNDPSVPKPILIDTRSAEEFEISHLPGAVHAESAEAARILVEKIDRHRPVVVYCSVGVRSARVAQGLMDAGFEKISNLQGSIFEWANRGLPLVRSQKPVSSVHPFNAKWGKLLDRQHWSHQP